MGERRKGGGEKERGRKKGEREGGERRGREVVSEWRHCPHLLYFHNDE